MSSTADSCTFVCKTRDETQALGEMLGKALSSGTVVSLRGPLGAGKTVIAKGIATSLGIAEAIVSPTFTLVQEYEGTMPFHHMDLYRLESAEELESIGGEELLFGRGVTVIEWSEKIDALLPPSTIRITISIDADQCRHIRIEGISL
jgi:tRNA threonylcarbamoyladenosine biosynthesis protein TsaE